MRYVAVVSLVFGVDWELERMAQRKRDPQHGLAKVDAKKLPMVNYLSDVQDKSD